MNKGFVMINRNILDKDFYLKANVIRVYLHLVLKANYKTSYWQGIEILKGSLPISYAKLGKDLGLSIRQIRSSIEALKLTGILSSSRHSKFQIISLSEYNQGLEVDNQMVQKVSILKEINNKKIINNESYIDFLRGDIHE